MRLRWQTALIFLLAATTYFLARTPALDEWDSVQFAQGVGDFNLWRHHPHPPGYPLYVAAGWLFSHALPLDVPTALQLVSALGGGLFVACWLALAAQGFGRAVGGWCALSLGTLLITWMTATKALTDAPAAGLLALMLLLVRNRRPVSAALAGAAVVGVRPQTFPVVLLVMLLSVLFEGRSPASPSAFRLRTLGVFFGGCLLWLLPTMWLQAHTPESHGDLLTYPAQLLAQWRWRLDQPKVYVGADTHGESFLLYRLGHHFLPWFTRGFGFPGGSVFGWSGIVIIITGWIFYVREASRERLESVHSRFWRLHGPWAVLYVAIVFCCLPGDQRYYLPIFPLLVLPALVGWGTAWPGLRGRWLTALVPAATLCATLPFVVENHREPAPPVRMLRCLQAQYPPGERARVVLLLLGSLRHAEWYAPDFEVRGAWDARGGKFPDDPPSAAPPVVYTDEPKLVAAWPAGSWQIVGTFSRSPLIYNKHNTVTLYRLERIAE